MNRTRGTLLAALVAAAALLAASPAAPAAEPAPAPWSVSASVDWSAGTLAIEVSLDMARSGLRLPSGRLEAQRLIDRELPGIVRSLVVDLPVDSHRSVADCIKDGTIDVADLLGLESSLEGTSSTFTKDMRSFVASYRLPLTKVAAIFVRHRSATPPDAPLEYRASRAYTGIVIYASGALPVRGERTEDRLRPCLFPRIFDNTMALLLDRNGVEPSALASWGEVGYAPSLDLSGLARVGDDPLKIDAVALFGSDRTDLIIPRDEAMKILALKANRDLLAAGRVIVVMPGYRQALGPASAASGTAGEAAAAGHGEASERAEGPLYEAGH